MTINYLVDDITGDNIPAGTEVEIVTTNKSTGDVTVSHISQNTFESLIEDEDNASLFLHD